MDKEICLRSISAASKAANRRLHVNNLLIIRIPASGGVFIQITGVSGSSVSTREGINATIKRFDQEQENSRPDSALVEIGIAGSHDFRAGI